MNRESLGMVEVRGLVVAIEIADAMVKAANIRLGEFIKTKGNGWMTVRVYGDVGAVNAAIDCGRHLAAQRNSLISSKVIPRPIDNIFMEKAESEVEETIEEAVVTSAAEPAAEAVKPSELKEQTAENAESSKETAKIENETKTEEPAKKPTGKKTKKSK